MVGTSHLEVREYYTMGSDPCQCSGIRLGPRGFDEYLAGRVRERHDDTAGPEELINWLSDIDKTNFDPTQLKSIMSHSSPREFWRIGESFAECFFEDYKDAKFPYHTRRDLKNPNSSPAGADLVGYFYWNGKTLFLFGEVKTTENPKCPPPLAAQLMTQLKNLQQEKRKNNLVLWMFFKVHNLGDENPEKKNFLEAMSSYSKEIIKTAGVLIRDTSPDEKDVRSIFTQLEKDHQQGLLEMLVLYLPVTVSRLPEMME